MLLLRRTSIAFLVVEAMIFFSPYIKAVSSSKKKKKAGSSNLNHQCRTVDPQRFLMYWSRVILYGVNVNCEGITFEKSNRWALYFAGRCFLENSF
jgi:hypothetical protein